MKLRRILERAASILRRSSGEPAHDYRLFMQVEVTVGWYKCRGRRTPKPIMYIPASARRGGYRYARVVIGEHHLIVELRRDGCSDCRRIGPGGTVPLRISEARLIPTGRVRCIEMVGGDHALILVPLTGYWSSRRQR